MKRLIWILALICTALSVSAQASYDWHNAQWAEGICEADPAHIFYRLPVRMQTEVSKGVWNQAVNPAGEYLHFRTTARSLIIKYKLAGKVYELLHMPATGVSGVDLYGKEMRGYWNWASPYRYTFGDTCTYVYRNLKITALGDAEFFLYLPLFASPQWVSVGVPHGEQFEFIQPGGDQPIVAYGTSILQGAAVSRPGLAWTNLLERNLGRKVINLGFSGSGRFEAPIFNQMAKVNAKLYILDCMPNLARRTKIPADTIEQRLRYGIARLRQDHADVPLLFAEHAAGRILSGMDTTLSNEWHAASMMMNSIFNKFKNEGIKHIYLLREDDIEFDINSTVEGTHPNDIGMMKYALAYEKKIREILHEPVGELLTQQPIEQYNLVFNWHERHRDVIANTIKTNPGAIIFGNSIIHFWGGEPKNGTTAPRGEAAWQQYMVPLNIQNAGFGNDRIENVLWRIYHGELEHFNGDTIIVNIGTNNLRLSTDDEIVRGLAFLLQQIRYRKPGVTIYIGGILPRRVMLQRVLTLNPKIEKMAKANGCKFFNFSKAFMNGNALNDSLFGPDGLHPNEKGYEVLGKEFHGLLKGRQSSTVK